MTIEIFWETWEEAAEASGFNSFVEGFDQACVDLEIVAFTNGATTDICIFA